MKPFDYTRSTTLKETIQLLERDDGSSMLLAGGTDLLTLMKADVIAPEQLIDIKRLDDLPSGITATADGLVLGALTTLAEIETSPLVHELYPLLAEAAALAATPQLRNMATLGGNLLQRPRCWYFRNSLFHCWLKGGEECQAQDGENQLHALFGGGPCYAVHPSDLAPALLALDATVRLLNPHGQRVLPLAELYALPTADRRRETILAHNELIHSIQIPRPARGDRGIYLKAMDRKAWAFALVSVAVMLRMTEGRVAAARIVLGGVAPTPWRVPAAEEALIGATVNAEQIGRAVERALAAAEPLAHNGYKVPLAQNLLRRAITTLLDATNGSA
jgi:xanthine dehydrogenase YagS FAD-binding subunit